jgi:NTP pyrophosphatase (non-canonical NTP hydrolase)
MNLDGAQVRARRFVEERDWVRYQTPKNLAQALAGEVGELSEIFQWLTEAESSQLNAQDRRAVEEELADIAIYVLRLADVLNIDLEQTVDAKLALNEARYPVDTSKGDRTKLGLPRFDGQGWWLGQATWVRASLRVAVSNSSGVR